MLSAKLKCGRRAGVLSLVTSLGALLATAHAQQVPQDPTALRRIARVEDNLLPTLVAANTQPRRLADRMRHYQVPGLSMAVVDKGQLVWAQAWGVAQAGETGQPMRPDTRLQAASISKAVSAVAALRLVEAGLLTLDVDINSQLRSWQMPPGAQTADKPVTLRRVLSHSAGLTVSGFGGDVPGSAIPTTVQVLNGVPCCRPHVCKTRCRRSSAPAAWALFWKAKPANTLATTAATSALSHVGWLTAKMAAVRWW
jgi:CubicO group peptidase (beta-lactamase class C family)